MAPSNSKVTIHMVSSLDGYIAKKNGDVSWLRSTDHYEKGVELSQEEMETFVEKIDCYVMGSHTFEHALELGWPYGKTPVFIATSRNLQTDNPNVQFYSGDLTQLVNDQLKTSYTNIWMVGGAMLTKEFIRLNLANEMVISIMPVILGDGISFFDSIESEKHLHLQNVTAYKDGMVELCYEIK